MELFHTFIQQRRKTQTLSLKERFSLNVILGVGHATHRAIERMSTAGNARELVIWA
jgi:hypothetical protein